MSDRKMGFMDLRLDLNYLKFVRNLPEIRLRYTGNLPKIRLRSAGNLPKIRLRSAGNLSEICLKSAGACLTNKNEHITMKTYVKYMRFLKVK